MIGAHDSYTYLRPTNILWCLIPFWWRCQTKSISYLYSKGVRMFDVRVAYDDKKRCWYTCHGLVNFKKRFNCLEDICIEFNRDYPSAYFRIMFEKDTECFSDIFKTDIAELGKKYNNLIGIYIKHPWEVIYEDSSYELKDYACHLFNWSFGKTIKDNLKDFDFKSCNLKWWAAKHNPKITQKLIDDKKIIYFMDYIKL